MATALDHIYSLEQIQCHATKYILNDYTICYRAQLIRLKLLPLLQDILFAVKSIKTPTEQFSITNYIEFSSSNTRSGTSNKLIPHRLNNVMHLAILIFTDYHHFGMLCHHYFNRR